MEWKEGLLAVSKAGHDKGKAFVIVRTDGDSCYVADGKGRSVDAPKRKNMKHLQAAGRQIGPVTNETVRQALRAYRRNERVEG